jgi:hypothetical protein
LKDINQDAGCCEQVSNLWDEYFSMYNVRDKDESMQRASARNSYVSLTAAANSNTKGSSKQTSTIATTTSSSWNAATSAGPHGSNDLVAASCPPVFEGDYWITECLRIIRLQQQRLKGYDGQDANANTRKCRDVLKHLMSRPWAQPFNLAVDPIALNIPTYRYVATYRITAAYMTMISWCC